MRLISTEEAHKAFRKSCTQNVVQHEFNYLLMLQYEHAGCENRNSTSTKIQSAQSREQLGKGHNKSYLSTVVNRKTQKGVRKRHLRAPWPGKQLCLEDYVGLQTKIFYRHKPAKILTTFKRFFQILLLILTFNIFK